MVLNIALETQTEECKMNFKLTLQTVTEEARAAKRNDLFDAIMNVLSKEAKLGRDHIKRIEMPISIPSWALREFCAANGLSFNDGVVSWSESDAEVSTVGGNHLEKLILRKLSVDSATVYSDLYKSLAPVGYRASDIRAALASLEDAEEIAVTKSPGGGKAFIRIEKSQEVEKAGFNPASIKIGSEEFMELSPDDRKAVVEFQRGK